MLVPLLILAALANAQNMRSWVSGVGSDANPCIRTAPCRTFAGALPKTAPGGEINCVDAGDFGNGSTLFISQAITIDCAGTFGSIFIPTFQDGIRITAGASDVVVLRNLSITSLNGGFAHPNIAYNSAKAVHIENVRISTLGSCLALNTSATSLLTVDNATLSDCPAAIFAGTSNGTAVVTVHNSRITNTEDLAVQADNGSRITIRNSTIYFSGGGVSQGFSLGTTLGSTVTVVNSTLGFSTSALGSLSSEFILAFGNTFVNTSLVYNPNGGTIFTGGDNNNSGSAPGTANGGSLPKI